MPIRFRCTCGKKYKVTEDFAGKTVKCPACGIRLVVPEKSTGSRPETESKIKPPTPTPPPTHADELELMTEPPPPPVDPEGDFAPDARTKVPDAGELELVTEPPPPPVDPEGDFAADARTIAPDAGEMELVTEPPPPPADAQADFGLPPEPEGPRKRDQPPQQEQPEGSADAGEAYELGTAPEGETCAKCGAALAADAVMCVECGTRVGAKMPEGVAKQEKETLPVGILIGAGAGLLLVVGMIAGLILLVSGGHSPAPEPAPQVAEPSPPPPPPPPPPPSPPEPPVEKTEPPEPEIVKVAWEGFNDPALAMRDRLRAIGAALRAYERENGHPASGPEEAGVSDEERAGIEFVPPESMPSAELPPVAYQEEPNADGTIFVLFGDGTVREVAADDLSAILPRERGGVMLPGANLAFLRKFDPALRVVNRRFAEVETLVDGRTVGRVKMGETATYPVAPGRHEIVLRAKGRSTAPLSDDFARGLTTEYALPRFQDIPVLDLRAYKRTFVRGTETDYTLDVSDPNTAVMKSAFETLRLPRVAGQASIANDLRSMRGVVEREDFKIVGIGDDPIYVSGLGLLEEGEIQYEHGRKVVFRRTPLETVRISRHVHLEAASLAVLPLDAIQAFQRRPLDGPTGRGDFSGAPGPEPDGKQRGATGEQPRLALPPRRQVPKPDLAAFGPSFGDTFSEAVAVLLNEARRIASEPESNRSGAAPPGRPAPSRFPEPEQTGRGDARQPMLQGIAPESGELPETPARETLAMLAVYGSAEAESAIDRLAAEVSPGTSEYSQLLLARTRCSGKDAIVALSDAAKSNPLGAAFGLAMIEDIEARQALEALLADWSAAQLTVAADAFPDAAGPGGRRRFVEAWFARSESKADSVAYLNPLLTIDPYIVESRIASRLLADGEDASVTEGNLAGWRVLAGYRHTEAVRVLVEKLGARGSAIRKAALTALAEVRHPKVRPCFKEALKSADKDTARAACAGLIAYGDPEAVAILAEDMPKDLCPALVEKAARELAKNAGPDRVADLLAGMLSHAEAAGTIEEETAEASEVIPEGVSQNPLLARSFSPPPGEREDSSAEESNGAVQCSAESILRTLADLGRTTPDVLAALDQARKHEVASVRAAAYRTTLTLRLPDAAAAVAAEGLNDAEPSVRTAVLAALRERPANIVVPCVEAALKDADISVRRAALETVAAAKAASPDILDAVAAGLQDDDLSIVEAAASAAEALKAPALGPPVVATLAELPGGTTATSAPERPTEPDQDLVVKARIALIRAAGALRARKATPSIALALSEYPSGSGRNQGAQGDTLRVEAVLALGAIGGPSAVSDLARALSANASSARQDAPDGLVTTLLTALTRYDIPDALKAWAPLLSRDTGGGNREANPELREILLKKLVSSCGSPGIYKQWILDDATSVSPAALLQLADMAEDAPPAWRPGLRLIGERFIGSEHSDTAAAAAELLSHNENTPEVLDALFKAFERDPAALADPFAEMLRRTRDPAMAPALKDIYRAIDRMSRASQAPGGTVGRQSPRTTERRSVLSETDRGILAAAVAEAFGYMGGEEATGELGRMCYAEKSPEVLTAAAEALARINSPEAIRLLCRFARGSGAIAQAAARALIGASAADVEEARKTFERLTKGFDPCLAAIGADGLCALEARGLLDAEDAQPL